MDFNIYRIGEKLILPTSAKTVAGYYLETEPVFVTATDNASEIERIVAGFLEQGNPLVSTPDWRRPPQPAVLKHAQCKSWASFVNRAACWNIHGDRDSYTVIRCKKMAGHAAWEPDFEHAAAIPGTGDLREIAKQIVGCILHKVSGLVDG